ncbi:hypothetical protein BTURTLESOX_1731 [bacterium endosymbiont of Bathymodiolus sp. 5 South]|nr:hypothetical protein BTURTLESOX_1731 [bacterium endosymbiont of Bathymodiolus sp. 5 South]
MFVFVPNLYLYTAGVECVGKYAQANHRKNEYHNIKARTSRYECLS